MRDSRFAETFSTLMFEQNMTVKEAVAKFGVQYSSIYKYLRGVNVPSLPTAIRIADYFGCSLDYLFGLTDYDNFSKLCNEPVTFPEILHLLLKERNITKYKMCRDTDIADQLVLDWCKGKRSPSVPNLIVLARYFDCTLDYLACRE